jgi:hypothetical protein
MTAVRRALLLVIWLLFGGVSVAFADPCQQARHDLDEAAREFQRQNREHWNAMVKDLYESYRVRIAAELAALNQETQARLKNARTESERGAIRTDHHARRSSIVAAWQEYHARKQRLDARFQEQHFAIQDEWYQEIWRLHDKPDCGYGTSAFRELLERIGEQIGKEQRENAPIEEPAGTLGIRG